MQDCYVIDNNGYVVLSERQNDTGRFFGEVEGAIMEGLVESGIYIMRTVYDFQALCSEVVEKESDGEMLINVSIEKKLLGLSPHKSTRGYQFSYLHFSAFSYDETRFEMDDNRIVSVLGPNQFMDRRNAM